eukprot:GHRR01030025.1.p1 GENE.GHRR01030025.1~~GHRR01030025.1.p1  ORF type:complete len:199 (+),score=74.00 GHRR01030025.1:335-931(+)
MTEAALMPTPARTQLAQLIFEGYGIPALSFVAAAPAAFYHHYSMHHQQQEQQQQPQLNGIVHSPQQHVANGDDSVGKYCGSSSGLLVCSGHSFTYVVPIHKGQPQWSAAVRCWASGSSATSHLQQLLSLRYPGHAASLLGNWQLIEGLKEAFCCCADDYSHQLQRIAAQPDTAGDYKGVQACCLGVAACCLLSYIVSP